MKVWKINLECLDCGEKCVMHLMSPNALNIMLADIVVNCPNCDMHEMSIVKTTELK